MPDRDVDLDQNELDLLLRAVRRTYQDRPSAVSLLRRIRFPEHGIPPFRNIAEDWQDVFDRLGRGAVQYGYPRLICAVLDDFRWHPEVRPLAERLGVRCADGPSRSAWVDRVLVIGASPDGTRMIWADREMREIRAVAEPLGVEVDVLPAAAFADLLRAVEHKPDVLHLACHGDGENLEFASDGDGAVDIVSAQQVVGLLAALRDHRGVQLHAVVLNCCDGAGFAPRFLEVAEVVVAHRGDLDDDCAIGFARELYRQARSGPDLRAAAHVAAALAAKPPHGDELPGNLVVLPDLN